MITRRKALGRGLNALIPQVETGWRTLAVTKIIPNPEQPRREFDADQLDELAQSIKEHGLLEPIIVRPTGDDVFEIVAGERRWRAAKLANLEEIPAIVRELTDREAMEIALVENLQREDLNPMEEALAYRKLMDEFDMTQEDVAKRVGKRRSTVANRLRLLGLDEGTRALLAAGSLTAGHAKALLTVNDVPKRAAIADRIVQHGLSVREVEDLARRTLSRESDTEPGREARGRERSVERAREGRTKEKIRPPEPLLRSIEDKLREALGTKVSLAGTLSSGKIEIQYYTDEDLERIVETVLGDPWDGSPGR